MKSYTQQHLFLFTIGPVQSFIAQARKTQDLYAGSQILSDLIKRAIEEVGQEKIIFPFISEKIKLETIESLPNRFIARLHNEDLKDGEDLKAFGTGIEQAVRKKWYGIATQSSLNCMKLIKKDNVSFKLKEAFFQQINQHLEIFWLFEPIIDNDYKKAYLKIEQNLGAIKNVRSFQQFNYNGIGERGRKCSIDGERNALFFGEGTNKNYTSDKKWNPDACILDGLPNVKVAKNEGLSAVSFAKRFYDKGGFPSTAEIALQNIETNASISIKINSIKDLFKKDFDYQLLFDENLTEDYFKKNGLNKKNIRETKNLLKEIRKLAKENSLKMNSYYALLSFDGDSMGEWLSKAESSGQHKNFSKLLIKFAQKATEIVNKNGKTVYAGGDDFLGFVNLQGLFDTIKELKADFDREVTKKVEIKNGTKEFTISMGVVIAHYKMPLGIVVKRVKEAEKAAKQSNDNKNSLAIDFITHSGSNRLGIIPFGENGDNLKKVEHIFNALKESFSDKWIRNFSEEFYLFPDKENEMKLDDEFKPLVEAELKRLIIRAYKSSETDKKAAAEKLKNNAYELLQATDFNYANFTEMLYITSALVSKTS